jgi:hypothetical protein
MKTLDNITTLEETKKLIDEADRVYLVLRENLGLDNVDVQYMLGVRDGYLKIYNLLNK